MTTFLLTLAITFVLLLTAGVTISYCKRRQSATSHGLTGMCHETGGTMCGCCGSRLLNNRGNSSHQNGCRKHDLPPTTRNN
ncbi:MAG: hypothetical protein ACD_75C00632G0001 [uncultured bacterium]|nr:MAG: hypothetical protein ACD_75C00632G0001 [uncultured bacterium]